MELHDTSVTRAGSTIVHRTQVRFIDDKLPPGAITFIVAATHRRWIDPSAVAAVPIALILAAKLGDDLTVQTPLHADVRGACLDAIALQSAWWGWRVPELHGPIAARPRSRGRARGLFFTRGIDSWGSLLAGGERARRQRPTHLIAVDGDGHLGDDRRAEILTDTRRAAAGEGLPLIDVRTDVRRLVDPHLDWGYEAHGAVLAGVAHLLSRGLGRATIGATNWWPDASPWGSHPALDPRWSTPALQIDHDGADEPRFARVGRVAEHQRALDALHVCWESGASGNCGACQKCLLTMTSLHLHGRLDSCTRFDRPFDPAAISALAGTNPNPANGILEHCDVVGLGADPIRQRWEEVPLTPRPGITYRPVSRPRRVALRDADGRPLDTAQAARAARDLAPLGVRVDHIGRPGAPVVRVGRDRSEQGWRDVLAAAGVAPAPEDRWDPDGAWPDPTAWRARRQVDASGQG